MRDTILYDSALRLFGDHVSPQLLAAAEAGTWPAALWEAVTEAGYLDVLADGPSGMVEAATILRAAGHHAAPIPLPETMLARFLCAAAGLEVPEGPLTLTCEESEVFPWGRSARAVAVVSEAGLRLTQGDQARFEPGVNLAGEPRDRLIEIADRVTLTLPDSFDSEYVLAVAALMRTAQMAGAMERALEYSTQYANDRVQFGRPIGKFQAIQHQIALLAEEAAASLAAVEGAALRLAEARPDAEFACAAAKIRAGEAAGKVGEIAHQVHGAIGFTEEHALHHLTRRLWSWRDEYGTEAHWAGVLGRRVIEAGAAGLWPLITAL